MIIIEFGTKTPVSIWVQVNVQSSGFIQESLSWTKLVVVDFKHFGERVLSELCKRIEIDIFENLFIARI